MLSIFFVVLFFLVGIILIIKGGDAFVDAASYIAETFGIPKFIIGATVVSLATTMPELIVSVMACHQGSNEIAVGNAIGSVACNIGLIMGISVFMMPTVIRRLELFTKGGIMIVSTAFLFAFCLNNKLSMLESIILLAVLLVYIFNTIKSTKTYTIKGPKQSGKKLINMMKFILGAAAIIIGANLLIDNGTILAQILGVPERIIALTMIALGTSLPELVTTLTALKKNEPNMSVGNILGANIIDVTMILPICSLTTGGALVTELHTSFVDIPLALLLMVIAVVPAIISKRFMKWQGFTMLFIYGLYVLSLCV